MNSNYELSASYRLSPQASYSFMHQSSYQGTSPAYEQAMKEYRNISRQSLKNMQGDYNKSSC